MAGPSSSTPPVDAQLKVPVKIMCSMGVKCVNALAMHAAATHKWAQDASRSESNKPPPLRCGYQYKTSAAITGHPGGWLPCKHFCCDFLTPAALEYVTSNSKEPKTCAELHICEKPGDRDYTTYRESLEAAGALKKPRSYQLLKNKMAQVRGCRANNHLGFHMCWVPPMLGTTYAGYHLCWVPPMLGTTYAGYHLCWVPPMLGTTCPGC
jgi:hypothetical protein